MGEDAKRLAARAALDELPQQGLVGLGSGTTSRIFVEELGARVRAGMRVTGVPTSESTRALAASVGIPLLGDEGPWDIDVNVDGADEVSTEKLDLIKGGGAAHTREKIVNFAARRNVIIVDVSKLSNRLGEKWPVPVEVIAFAHGTTREHLARLGNPVLRARADGAPVRTDAGNLIYDLATGPIDDPGALDRALRTIPGVVETGLFVGRADVVLVADGEGVRRLVRHP
jgi:ribose 5-phosphate isomerase A